MRKHKHVEHENHERWLVSYADFITLLFAFFTVLYATSQQDLKKEQDFQKSIRQSFGMVGSGQADGNFKTDNPNDTVIPPVFDTFARSGEATPEQITKYVEEKLREEGADQDTQSAIADVQHDAVGVRIFLASSALFGSGSAVLKESSVAALDRVGSLLAKTKKRIIVEGHTDDAPLRSEQYASNWELSAARATKVVRYFISRHKLDAKRLTAVAYADQKPVAPNDSEANRARNRRIEILIVTETTEP